METIIIRPENELLKEYIEYFLFLKKSDDNLINYTTFPNSNLCLAIYNQNKVSYVNDGKDNLCSITVGGDRFSSRIYGFHNSPFRVHVQGDLDQICIVFRAAALGVFTSESLYTVRNSERAVEDFLQLKDSFLLEQVFHENLPILRAKLLEKFLVNQLNNHIPPKLLEALEHIRLTSYAGQDPNIAMLCRKLDMSDTTLYRLFMTNLGQNPQQFLKTIRFRRALPMVLGKETQLTQVGLCNNYYDQAHFIKEFKALAGLSPKKLQKQVSVRRDQLAWIFEEIQG